jgi:hypothetical protein
VQNLGELNYIIKVLSMGGVCRLENDTLEI